MNRSMGIDHITLCVKDLHAAEYLFTKILGFEVIWSARDVGSEKSSMDTIVVQRGNAKVALMQGRDYAIPDDVQSVAEPVLAHRILSLSSDGFGSGNHEREVVRKIVSQLPVPL